MCEKQTILTFFSDNLFSTQAEDLCANFNLIIVLSTSSDGKDDNWNTFRVSKKNTLKGQLTVGHISR